MTKVDTEVSKRRQGYPAKKPKKQKFYPEHNYTHLENEIIRLEDENKELKARLEEKSQLCAELTESYQTEKAMNELDKKTQKEIEGEIRVARIVAVAGIIFGIIALTLSLFLGRAT